jgi:hypothetical protein
MRLSRGNAFGTLGRLYWVREITPRSTTSQSPRIRPARSTSGDDCTIGRRRLASDNSIALFTACSAQTAHLKLLMTMCKRELNPDGFAVAPVRVGL